MHTTFPFFNYRGRGGGGVWKRVLLARPHSFVPPGKSRCCVDIQAICAHSPCRSMDYNKKELEAESHIVVRVVYYFRILCGGHYSQKLALIETLRLVVASSSCAGNLGWRTGNSNYYYFSNKYSLLTNPLILLCVSLLLIGIFPWPTPLNTSVPPYSL